MALVSNDLATPLIRTCADEKEKKKLGGLQQAGGFSYLFQFPLKKTDHPSPALANKLLPDLHKAQPRLSLDSPGSLEYFHHAAE